MLTKTGKDPIIDKTEELCQTILEQPAFTEVQQKLERFMQDEQARVEYQRLVHKQTTLQRKQQQGTLTDEEILEFEQDKEAVLRNPVIQAFNEAQQQIHKVQESISQYVSETFELYRVPQEEDFEEGSCGPQCNCH